MSFYFLFRQKKNLNNVMQIASVRKFWFLVLLFFLFKNGYSKKVRDQICDDFIRAWYFCSLVDLPLKTF